MNTSINTTTFEQGRLEFFSVFTIVSSKVKWCMATGPSLKVYWSKFVTQKLFDYLYYTEQFFPNQECTNFTALRSGKAHREFNYAVVIAAML